MDVCNKPTKHSAYRFIIKVSYIEVADMEMFSPALECKRRPVLEQVIRIS